LGNHPWNEPLEKITSLPSENIQIITPMIGQTFHPINTNQTFPNWWKNVN